MALLMVMLSLAALVQMTSEEEVSVWAWTEDYDMIIVEGSDMEPLYGIQNRHTLVIEIQEPVFSNAVGYMMDLQEQFDAVSEIIAEDGSIMDDQMIKVSYKPKKEYTH